MPFINVVVVSLIRGHLQSIRDDNGNDWEDDWPRNGDVRYPHEDKQDMEQNNTVPGLLYVLSYCLPSSTTTDDSLTSTHSVQSVLGSSIVLALVTGKYGSLLNERATETETAKAPLSRGTTPPNRYWIRLQFHVIILVSFLGGICITVKWLIHIWVGKTSSGEGS